MLIDLLADHPEYISILAPALVDHWRFASPEDTIAAREAKLREHTNRETFPLAWVAHVDGELLGTAALRLSDLPGREDLTPWLGGVFVMPKFRRRGIGSALCAAVESCARLGGIRTLYLFTLDQQHLYSHLGWRVFERATWHGHVGEIMAKEIYAV